MLEIAEAAEEDGSLKELGDGEAVDVLIDVHEVLLAHRERYVEPALKDVYERRVCTLVYPTITEKRAV